MILDLEWLKEFVKLKHKSEELAQIFESLGFSPEQISSDFLDLEITPNRGDCLSILGLAREYAAKSGQKVKSKKETPGYYSFPKSLKIEIKSPQTVPRYTGLIIKEVKVKSPSFSIVQRLKRFAINPINSVVDATNLVMLERGTPLHAFDLDKIKGNLKIFKTDKPRSLKTLDGVLRHLPDNTIVIEDDKRLIDLAGIMGGAEVAIDNKTSSILLQAAVFDKELIRTTSKYIGLSTEASYRYERGIDFEATKEALERAAQLIIQNGGEIVERFDMVLKPRTLKKINLDSKRIFELGGLKVSFKEATSILKRLGFKQAQTTFIPPSFRHDVEFEEDLIEEILRIKGYQSIPQRVVSEAGKKLSSFYNLKENLKDELTKLGWTEVQTYSFLSDVEKEKWGKDAVAVSNPLSKEFSFLRPDLTPLLIKTVAKNPWASQVKIFEIGRVFQKDSEEEKIGFASTTPPSLIRKILGSNLIKIVPSHPLGLLYKLRRQVFMGEISVEQFIKKFEKNIKRRLPTKSILLPKEKNIYRAVSVYPPVVRDIAIVVNKSLSYEEIGKVIYRTNLKVFLVELFDEYSGPQIGTGKKNLAFHIFYQDFQKTLTKTQVDAIEKKIISELNKKFKARLR